MARYKSNKYTLQGKINDVRRISLNGINGPGYEVHTTPVIILNVVGFRMIGVAGTTDVRDIHYSHFIS